MQWLLVLFLLGLASCGDSRSTDEILADLGGRPCPDSDFICVTIMAPIDHNDPDGGETIPVTFAVLPAAERREGVFVTAVGGPGASGVEESTWRYPYLDAEIRDYYDIVFFDQRGLGMSEELTCTETEEGYETDEEEDDTDTDTAWDQLVVDADDYVKACTEEIDRPELLANLGTAQAAADLELFRQTIGYERLVLYGESYGTKFAQVFATDHPGSVERLILDGTVDLTKNDLEATSIQIESIEAVLRMIFDACDRDIDCSSDMGRTAHLGYQQLLDNLSDEPATVAFPTGKGPSEDRALTAEDVGYLAFTSLYGEQDRMIFLRALAAYTSRGDLIPLLRLENNGFGDDISSVVYDAVTCLDTPLPGDNASSELDLLAQGRESADPSHRWLYASALECPFWPGVDRIREVPEPFVGKNVPTLVVAAEADPATPYAAGVSVFEGLDRGYLLTIRGGSHVMFGRGISCIDEAVTAFVLDGSWPEVESCDAEVISTYVPLIPTDLENYEPVDVLWFADNELYYLPELVGWDWEEEITVGCAHGGEVTFIGTQSGVRSELDECGLTDDLVLSGTGGWDSARGVSELDVSFIGDDCTYRYKKRWEDASESLESSCGQTD